jgi:HAD superfamily hydrolase (TIGR01662 family)
VIVSNQDGLGTEAYQRKAFEKVQDKLVTAFENEGITFEEILLDESTAADPSPSRKPATGMVADYLSQQDWDRSKSFVIGDRLSDIELAKNMGIQGVLMSNQTVPVSLTAVASLTEANWDDIFSFLRNVDKSAIIDRKTKETDIRGKLLLYGSGKAKITTGLGFFDHMLEQLARQLTRATVIATASRPQSKAWVERLGAHHVLDHSKPLQAQLAGTGLADITDAACVNRTSEHYADIVTMMRPQGRICLIDDPAEPLDIKLMKQKSLSLHWEFMFTRALFRTSDMSAQHTLLTEVARLLDKGVLQTTLGEHYGAINAANLERAHEAMKTEHTLGKVVLEGFYNRLCCII